MREIMKIVLKVILAVSAIVQMAYAEEIYSGVDMIKGVEIETREGYSLKGNLFKPSEEGQYPVIVTMTPYGKDKKPHFSYDDGVIDASKYTAYETLDPKFWVPNGYALLVVDSTGTNESGGQFSLLSDQEAKDYYDVIEWAGTQKWSTGAVSTAGVSYLAMNQWKVAAMNPPHLKAIMPWHGMSNIYRDMLYTGGIEETNFFKYWYGRVINKNANSPIADAITYQKKHPFYNDIYKQQVADLSKITVPAYIGAAWSDNGLHLTGTMKAYEDINSKNKWLEVTGRKKWEQYYSWGAQNRMLAFSDYYLKGKDNGWPDTPQVRYEQMDSYYLGEEKHAGSFPLPNTKYQKLYIGSGGLTNKKKIQNSRIKISEEKQLRVNYTFAEETIITGYLKASLFIESVESNDFDVFIEVEKFNANGHKVNLPIFGTDEAGFTLGMLRASQRELDNNIATQFQPAYTFTNPQYLNPGQIVKLDIALSPTSIRFKAGETLSMIISQNDINSTKAQHKKTINKGDIIITSGKEYQSYLQIPIIKN